ncbi:MAG: B12-binding domain-containing radical SAM protein [Candidatus Hinthialibacter sp.]
MTFLDLIARERHLLSFPNAPHGPVGLIYPNVYTVGMASLGFQQIYRLMRESSVSVERIFYDKKGRETRSIENKTPLFRFPILAASFTYELDIINLLQMLIRGGVNPLSDPRGDGAPILIVGGQAASANPRLLQRIADVVYLGEGEELVPQLCQTLIERRDQPRRKILEALAEIPSVYAPSVHGEFERSRFSFHTVIPIDKVPCHTAILAGDDEFGGAFLLELSRGCKYHCKFCIVHYMNGTARYRDYDSLIDVLDHYKDQYQKVGLLGAAVADHPRVEDITEWLVRRGKQASTSSLRAERLTERFLDLLREGGQHNITVAPESGDLNIRKSMLKGVRDDQYFQLAEWAGKRRFPSLKLYFIIGAPGADPMQEAAGIVRFSSRMGDLFSGSGGGRITVAVSPFVPKPTTPWQCEEMWDPKAVKKAARYIRKKLAFRGNMKVPPVNVKEARAEAILSWCGPEITGDLLRLAEEEISIESAFQNFDLDQVSHQARRLAQRNSIV